MMTHVTALLRRDMDAGGWEQPVTFETATLGVYLTVSSTAEAARVLLDHWPIDDGKQLRRARHACLATLQGECSAEKAREAFLKAAAEADVFIRS
jgi:hypothetical protein